MGKKRKKTQARSEDTLANTTLDILKQCKSNPHANVRMSGKKRRKLAKLAKRETKEQMSMEVSKPRTGKQRAKPKPTHNQDSQTETMETS